MSFTPIPAIDIRDGRCVRLVRGDFGQQTVYGDDPVDMARRWEAEGASRLHVVDLDGARGGERKNARVVERLLRSARVPVQVGGGVRTLDAARELLDQGADRVIVGTAAAENVDGLGDWIAVLGAERLIVGVDARNGRVMVRGWEEESSVTARDLCRSLMAVGVRRILFTDVSRDGTLEGPNLEAIQELVAETDLRVIASGGVGDLEHVRQLVRGGAEAVVLGKALYDGRLRLADVLRVAAESVPRMGARS